MRARSFSKKCFRLLTTKPASISFFFLITAYFIATSLIALLENTTITDACIRGLPAFFGELGTPESPSLAVQLAMLLSLLFSLAFLTVVTAAVTTFFVELCRKGGVIVKKVKLSDHVIICGWNFQGKRMVEEILVNDHRKEVVILADMEVHPLKNNPLASHVHMIQGDPTEDAALNNAGIQTADSVIVLTDFTKNANEADAQAMMIVLAAESLNRNAHSCVQIMNSSNRVHLERAHADEIVCLDQMGGNLIISSAINHGVSHVVQELLTFNTGSEVYRYDDIPPEYEGIEFSDAVKRLADKRMILIGFETIMNDSIKNSLNEDEIHELKEEGRAIVVNPQGQYNLCKGDALFIISETEPKNL